MTEQDPFQKYAEVALIGLATLQAVYGGLQTDYVVMMLAILYGTIGGVLLGTRFNINGR